MDDASMCIATAISLLVILIYAKATYGTCKQHAAWITLLFCYQIFDFALNTLVVYLSQLHSEISTTAASQFLLLRRYVSESYLFGSNYSSVYQPYLDS